MRPLPPSLPPHRALLTLPPAESAQVWIDFDGTITQRDLLDELIIGYSIDDSWKQIEARWQAGEIGSRECLAGQMALLRIEDGELEKVLDAIQLDPGLVELVRLLDRFNVPRAVLSDGIDQFIHRTFNHHGVKLPVRSNAIARSNTAITLLCPLFREDCQSKAAHCKCGSIAELQIGSRTSIYIGDGRSDLCPARKVDFVFAKGALAAALEREGRGFTRYETLLDVKRILESQWSK